MTRKIKLISFADGPFSPRKQEFMRQARNMNVFDDVTVFNGSTLDEKFQNNHMEFMVSSPRGFGYWIWKPQIVRQALNNADENDLICQCL